MARQTLALETHFSLREVQASRRRTMRATLPPLSSISLGSTRRREWLSCPVRLKTLSGINYSYTDGPLTRAADVILKERGDPSGAVCARNAAAYQVFALNLICAAEIGAVIMPPVPLFIIFPDVR